CDAPTPDAIGRGTESEARSLCAISLGTDGVNLWFLVVDGRRPRRALPADDLARLKFIAGRCTAIVAHRDRAWSVEAPMAPEGGAEHFAGWPILRDIDRLDADDEEANLRISLRFLVARALRAALDDDL